MALDNMCDDAPNVFYFRLNQNENGDIEVEDFLRFIDSCKDTSAASVPKKFFVSIKLNSVFNKNVFIRILVFSQDIPDSNQNPELIDWSAFIDVLGLEEQLKQGVE